MRILILGIDGMIGHKIAQSLSNNYQIIGSTRKDLSLQSIGLNDGSLYKKDFIKDDYNSFFNEISPDVIINCIGITTRRGIASNPLNTDLINTQFPHKISEWVSINNRKLIHFSTDCIFSGNSGDYLDEDKPDADDIYGLSKAKGEINNNYTLTIRSSMIGREIYNRTELFEWLYSMRNRNIEGYSNVIYSGVTTVWMGNVIKEILENHTSLAGIYNISSKPISKYQLLLKFSEAFKLNINISENSNIKSNKVLISKKFTEITGINAPNWDDLIPDFKNDCEKFTHLYKN